MTVTRDRLARLEKTMRRMNERATLARLERDDAIRSARAQGMGVREIARVIDVDPARVSRIIGRNGN